MNKVKFENYKNSAKFEEHKNKTDVELIRIKSDFYFMSAAHIINIPKERSR